MRRRHVRALATVVGAIALLLSVGQGASHAATEEADFNGDGYNDLVLANNEENVGGVSGAGAVRVLYGSVNGPSLKGDLYLTEASQGMKGNGPAHDAWFGNALAEGDFDGDGRDDLAVGVPSASLGPGEPQAGAVYVLYGSRRGIMVKGSQYLTEATPGIRGNDIQATDDSFGGLLAAGDFDGDGRDDLAIGNPSECLSGEDCAFHDGAVNVLYGGRNGIRTFGGSYLTESMPGMKGVDRSGNDFGWGLVAADFDGDGRSDLAVGANDATIFDIGGDGALHVLYGTPQGISLAGNQYFTEKTPGIPGQPRGCCDEFGGTIAAGRINGDRSADLVLGMKYWETPSAGDSYQGSVIALYGSGRGLQVQGSQFLTQDAEGMAGPGAEADGEFGWSLATGDIDGDRRDDVVVGTPLAPTSYGSVGTEGAVTVIYGARKQLTTRDSQYLTQDNPRMKGPGPKRGDWFGWGLGISDLNGDGRGDLGIGAPQEVVALECHGNGAMHLLYGRRSGVRMRGNRYLTAGTPGIAGPGPQGCAGFGQTILGSAL